MKSIDLLKPKTIPGLSSQFIRADKILINNEERKDIIASRN